MNKIKRSRIAGWGDYVTSTISVSLVLFILGLVGFVNISFSGINRQLKEKMGFTVVLADSVAPATIDSLKLVCDNAPYVSSYRYLSAEDVMAEETSGEGADLVDLLGVNPYAAMFEIKVGAAYADVDSISSIMAQWQQLTSVDETTANTEMIANINRNAGLINTILAIMAAALLLISFVLINNTVRLTVYSRRFLIHTMKLVGATGGFIRRPFLMVNAVQGVIAGVLASGFLALFVGWTRSLDMGIESLVTWNVAFCEFGLLVVLGVAICVLAAIMATNRYLRKNYDEMFE